MLWNSYIYFAVSAMLLWAVGAVLSLLGKRRAAIIFTSMGLAVFFTYIMMMWVMLERPPLRTMGETRLWYSLFLPLAGLIVFLRYGYRWILSYSALLATVFACINIFKPEIHEKTLMPALQSPWFAPHVIVYMLAYALLGVATLMALVALMQRRRQSRWARQASPLDGLNSLVTVGWVFLTMGMLFGALWAKEAWGHYWTWDPKETWAAVTWMGYLVYIHLGPTANRRLSLLWLLLCFVMLQMCWWGINFLPSAQGASVHTYG